MNDTMLSAYLEIYKNKSFVYTCDIHPWQCTVGQKKKERKKERKGTPLLIPI